jgi:Tc5 transposase DNA-binding domain
MISSEAEITDALRRFSNGDFRSLRHCSEITGVNRQTLSARLAGGKSQQAAQEIRQKLSPELEKELVEWIILEDRAGNAPGYARVRAMAEEMLAAVGRTGNDAILGEKWHINFIHRHDTQIGAVFARKVDAARINGATKDVINEWFDRYDQIVAEHKITPSNEWNMDESGLEIGDFGREKVLMELTDLSRETIVKKPLHERWNTTIECVSASGSKIAPLVIFTGKNVWTTWIPHQPDPNSMRD